MSEFVSNGHAESSRNAAVADPHPPEQGRLPPMQYETDLSSVLAFAPRETMLEVTRVTGEEAQEYCARLGVVPGDWITRRDGLRDHVLLTTADGRRVRLPLPVAMLIEVEPALRS